MAGEIKLRMARADEAPLLTMIAARSKSHWPYDKAYLELCNQVTHVTEGDIQSWIFTVAENATQVMGFSGLAEVKSEPMLDHLWIEPEFIGYGIGARLFHDTVPKAKNLGWKSFLIASDPYAEKFYLKMGAKRIGERESEVRPGFFLPLLEYDFLKPKATYV